ncbi:MAG: homocysteine methyltransferase [Ruminococcaceae bacterium]|nr:homocysteine methyltransferase [Oscillospiraceae bacterium]
MNILDFLKENILYLDGSMGTLLQKNGLKLNELPEEWNITHPDVIRKIHLDYYNSGSNVVSTNTFGANTLKFNLDELEKIIKAAFENAYFAKENSTSKGEKFIALDIGPTGKLLKPYGDLGFEDAVKIFADTIKLGVKYGADLIFIETMNDSYETKAALLAAKENSNLPIFVSNAYSEDGKLMTGATPEAMVALLEGMGADAIGANCSLGPKMLEGVVKKLLKYASVPVILKPNAGLPKEENGKTLYDVSPEEFSEDVKNYVKDGVRIVGGCCGTTPEYIKEVFEKTKDLTPKPAEKKDITMVSSYTHAVLFDKKPVLIGERINPTGKKRFKQALLENDINYILEEGIKQHSKGVDILDVNVGLPDIDENKMLTDVVEELQTVTNLPLQIDTSNFEAMENALRCYNGKAMINSVNGKKESMEKIFPLAKKYGGVIVALTLDENGIPENSEGRLKIAKKIIETAKEYGIDKKDIIFDTLAMALSADKDAPKETLKALYEIKNTLKCHTSLGVSNVSFGLPSRDAINSTFFAMALTKGLSAAIMNPYSFDMMKTYYSYCALCGMDENFEKYIDYMSNNAPSPQKSDVPVQKSEVSINSDDKTELQLAIEKGLKDKAGELTQSLIKTINPFDIIQNEVIPALDVVGKGFEEKKVYLPQLLMSAEAAKASFECIKQNASTSKSDMTKKCTVVIATVHGDIHDIGKNIVKLLLENYGFDVIDLGKDVPPETILEKVTETNAPIVGLSALMTTTVPKMEETIKLLNKKAPNCKTIVGGAVLNKEYADKIGADKYAKDAMEAVRYADIINSKL